jgi:hypothetical protein
MADDFGDGWGEDLDDLIDDSELGDASDDEKNQRTGTEGWGDDFDNLEDGSSSYPVNNKADVIHRDPFGKNAGSGWDGDDDLFSDAVEQTPVGRSRQPNQQVEQVFQELTSYVESLMILQPSINAVLQAEYNNPEKAAELLHYYLERPQLRQYTIDKELSRMDYQVILQHGTNNSLGGEEPFTCISNKQEIAQLFKLHKEIDLLVRCANQSLLADLLQVMTGPDGLVRPQYMATCLAEYCQFTIRFSPGISGGLVECNSQLLLSLPDPTGNRYPVAKLRVHILLGVPTDPMSPPMIEYRLQTMDIVIPSMDVLRPTAHFLVESGLIDHPPMSPFPESAGVGPIQDNDTFRDVFLQQSQNMLQNSTVGLKSAWQQIDAVAGFSSKMNMVQKILPTTDGSVLEAAMLEQDAFQIQMQAQQQRRRVATENTPSGTVPVSYPPPSGGPQPPTQARPTSLLGSFMGAIAKSVSIPDEDPSIYEQYTASNQLGRTQSKLAFPRPGGAAMVAAPISAPLIHLYRKDDIASQQEALTSSPRQSSAQPAKKTSPWLSQMTGIDPVSPETSAQSQTKVPIPAPAPGPGSPARRQQLAETSPQIDADDELGLNDGWGEEDMDLELDEEGDQDPLGELREVEHPNKLPSNLTTNTVGDLSWIAKSPKEATGAQAVLVGYSVDDDIMETRKRWVNPRPGPRTLHQVLSP